MPDLLLRADATAWNRALASLGLTTVDTVGVYGHDADRVAAALRANRPSAVVRTGDIPPQAGGAERLADVDLVVLLHAWRPLRRLDSIARGVAAHIPPGATLVMGDLNVPLLRRGSDAIYPSAALYRRHPEVGAWFDGRSASPAQLDTAAIRAGLDRIRGSVVDLPVAIHRDVDAFHRAVGDGQWRGFDQLSVAERGDLVTGLRISPSTVWPRTETEPWYLVAGNRRTVEG